MAHPSPRNQYGFSMVEIMVGLAIGLATVVIMLQMLKNADASKRISAGGNDAQMNGTLALYTLQREIQASGYGISAYSILSCPLSYTTSGDNSTVTIALAPVTINASAVPAGDIGTDTLLVVYGSGNGSTEGDGLIATSTANTYQIATTLTASVNDLLIAQGAVTPTSPCSQSLTLDKVSRVVSASALSVTPGVSGLAVGSVIYNVGQALTVHAYAVRNGNLTMCDYSAYDCGNTTNVSNTNIWVPIAGNIVTLRAQYGRDTNNLPSTMTGVVSQYDQITPGSPADNSGVPVYCSWARTLAVRLALVARSEAYDKGMPTTAQPTWVGSTANTSTTPTSPTALPFDLTQGGAISDSTWKGYRYKTIQTSVPLRNSIWQGSQPKYQSEGGTGC